MALLDRLTERVEGFLDDAFIPEDLRHQLERASRLIEQDDHDQALAILRRAETVHPPHHRTYHLLGLAHFGREDWYEARSSFERAADMREEPATYLYAGLAAEQLGDMAEAKLHFQKALGLSEHPPFEFDLHFGLGRVLAEVGRTDKAIHELRKARELEPDEAQTTLVLSRALFHRGDVDEADELLEAVGDAELGLESLMLKARIAEQRGHPDRAARLFEQTLEEAPDHVDAMLGAARTHLASGAPAPAQQYLLKVVDREDDAAHIVEAQTLLGEAADKAGDADRALRAYRRAVDRAREADLGDGVVDRARLGAGRLLFERDRVDEATLHFERVAAESSGRISDEARLELARGRLAGGKPSEARRLLDELSAPGTDDRQPVGSVGIRPGPGNRRGPREFAPGELGDTAPPEDDTESASRTTYGDEPETLDRPEPAAPATRDADFGARVRHVTGLTALEAGDPAEALVAFQDALHLADKPSLRETVEADRECALRDLTPDWQLPDRADTPVALEQVLDQTREFLQNAPHLEQFASSVHDLQQTMAEPLSVAIVGEFNVGKSTLVNALVEEEVVPMGILPTTAHTCYIRYGPRKTARVVYKDQHAGAEERTVEVDYAEARRRMDEETDQIAHLEFLYPHPQLRSIHFWDTPGFNATEQGHDEIASRALHEAEAILWVFDAKQTLTRSELDRLEEIEDAGERVIALVNKADELDDHQLAELREYLDTRLAPLTAGNFAVSARDALRRATADRESGADGDDDGNDAAAPPTAFTEFRQFLDRRFVQRAGRIKTLEVRRRLATLTAEIDDHVDELLEGFDEMTARLDDLSDWLEDLDDECSEQSVRREADTVDDQFDFALTAVAREIREALRPRGTIFSAKVLDEADRTFALELFKSRLDDVLEHSRQRVIDETRQIEEQVTARLEDVLEALSVQNARTINRRLDGLYDELRMMRLLLAERVYGQLRAHTHGRIDAGGPTLLEEVEADDSEDLEPWKCQLRSLLPDGRAHVDARLTDWYSEFFLAARRFSDRVRRDLQLLRLEAEYRYDTTDLRSLLET